MLGGAILEGRVGLAGRGRVMVLRGGGVAVVEEITVVLGGRGVVVVEGVIKLGLGRGGGVLLKGIPVAFCSDNVEFVPEEGAEPAVAEGSDPVPEIIIERRLSGIEVTGFGSAVAEKLWGIEPNRRLVPYNFDCDD